MSSSALTRLAKRAGDTTDSREVELDLDKVIFDPDQPRTEFAQESIEELGRSMQANGQIQAIVVQDNGDGTFIVVVGERRTRASRWAGFKTIRAKVRTDLTNYIKRLLFQLAENINRESLSPTDTSRAIMNLMKDVPGQREALNQREIAAALGKSEGWVSRHIKFADAELQRRWVSTGILDTVEKVYRVTLLSQEMQAEIERRVALPEDHEEFLPKPLPRTVIDSLATETKIAKMAAASAQAEDKPGIDATLTTLAAQGQQNNPTRSPPAPTPGAGTAPTPLGGQEGAKASGTSSGGYQLPESVRKQILQGAQTPGATMPGKPVAPPPVSAVHCKVEAHNIAALLKFLAKSNKDVSKAANSLPVQMNIPGQLAQLLANALTGKRVKPIDVPDTIHRELAKLR